MLQTGKEYKRSYMQERYEIIVGLMKNTVEIATIGRINDKKKKNTNINMDGKENNIRKKNW